MNVLPIHEGDHLLLRKKHPCGSDDWEVVRTGADIGMICQGCGRYVLIARSKLEPRIKEIKSHSEKEC